MSARYGQNLEFSPPCVLRLIIAAPGIAHCALHFTLSIAFLHRVSFVIILFTLAYAQLQLNKAVA